MGLKNYDINDNSGIIKIFQMDDDQFINKIQNLDRSDKRDIKYEQYYFIQILYDSFLYDKYTIFTVTKEKLNKKLFKDIIYNPIWNSLYMVRARYTRNIGEFPECETAYTLNVYELNGINAKLKIKEKIGKPIEHIMNGYKYDTFKERQNTHKELTSTSQLCQMMAYPYDFEDITNYITNKIKKYTYYKVISLNVSKIKKEQ